MKHKPERNHLKDAVVLIASLIVCTYTVWALAEFISIASNWNN